MGGLGWAATAWALVFAPCVPSHWAAAYMAVGREAGSSPSQRQGQDPALVTLGPRLQAPWPFESRREAESGGLEQPQSSIGSIRQRAERPPVNETRST